jgi:hypothetical protein
MNDPAATADLVSAIVLLAFLLTCLLVGSWIAISLYDDKDHRR